MLNEEELLLLLLEDAAAKIDLVYPALVGKKSKWPDKDKDERKIKKFLLSLKKYDPTGDQGVYIPYIVSQMSRNNLVLNMGNQEDGNRLLNTLTYFNDNKNKWTGNKDIFSYKNWRDLEEIVLKFQEEGKEFKSGKELRKEISKGARILYEVTIPNKQKTRYSFVELTTPEAVSKYGAGTRWCTTNVDTARSYLEKKGPMYIIFRDSKEGHVGRSGQVMQITANGSDIMLYDDKPIGFTSPALDFALAKWLESGTCPIPEVVKKIRSTSPDYPGKP